MLDAIEATEQFDANRALDKVSLGVAPGANGAGKATPVNLSLSFLQPTSGKGPIGKRDVVPQPVGRESGHGGGS